MHLPAPRSGHVAVSTGDILVVWGGFTEKLTVEEAHEERYLNPHHLWLYNTVTEKWVALQTQGEQGTATMPHPSSGCAAVIVDNYVYTVGGHCMSGCLSNVYRLNLRSCMWEHLDKEIESQQMKMSPRDKHCVWHWNNKLYVFGGFGPSLKDSIENYAQFILDETGGERGWNDQLLIFDIERKVWTPCNYKGDKPSARAAHAVAMISGRVFLFGGRHQHFRLNDLHCLDLATESWSGRLAVDGPEPCGRSWHTMTSITDNLIFMYGGYSSNSEPLGDRWLLNTQRLQWTRLEDGAPPRLWHKACLMNNQDVLVFGGCCTDILSDTEASMHTNTLLAFRLSPKSLYRLSIDCVVNHHECLSPLLSSLPRSLHEAIEQKVEARSSPPPTQQSPKDDAKTCAVS